MNKNIFLVTSNVNKLKEFQRFGIKDIQIEKGVDIAEVDADADPETVISYKALEAGSNRIVEDTSLHIEDEDVGVNIRWLLDNLEQFNGKKAVWEVLLGYNVGGKISIFRGVIEGTITDKVDKSIQGFGFDQYFIPNGQDKTLHELKEAGVKDSYSARKVAVENLLAGIKIREEIISTIPTWTGKMQ